MRTYEKEWREVLKGSIGRVRAAGARKIVNGHVIRYAHALLRDVCVRQNLSFAAYEDLHNEYFRKGWGVCEYGCDYA